MRKFPQLSSPLNPEFLPRPPFASPRGGGDRPSLLSCLHWTPYGPGVSPLRLAHHAQIPGSGPLGPCLSRGSLHEHQSGRLR